MSRHLSRWQAGVLGLAIIGGLALGWYALFVIDQRRGLDSSAFAVHSGFADIGGVEVGTRVRIQGMDAGEVEAVVPPATAGAPVQLRLRLSGKFRHLVSDDARVQIAAESLLAGKIVRILPGSAGQDPVADGASLAAVPFEELSDTVAQAATKLQRVLTEVDTAMTEFRSGQGTAAEITQDLAQATSRLHSVLAKVDATIDGVQRGEGTLGQLVKNDSLYRELNGTLAEVKGALQDVRAGEGSLGKLVKSNEVYMEAVQSMQDVRKMVASVKQNSDAIKSLPVVRSYVVDAHKELVRPDCKRYRKWFPETKLFEAGQAILTTEGKAALDEVSPWLNEEKASTQEVVIAAFAGAQHDGDFAKTLTEKQSQAVLEYLKSNHKVHRTGFWFWSNRSVRAVGVGNNPPPVPETETLPAARIDLIIFVPPAR